MKLIVLNGPSGCGKDFVAGKLKNMPTMGLVHRKLSDPLKEIVRAAHSYSPEQLDQLKDVVSIGGMYVNATPRDEQKQLSKTLAELFGPTILGKMFVDRVRMDTNYPEPDVFRKLPLNYITDAGVANELEPIVNWFGKTNVLIVQISRDNCEFGDDYRVYIEMPEVTTVNVHNEGNDEFVEVMHRIVRSFIGGHHVT